MRNSETDILKESKKKQIVDRIEDRGAWSSESGELEVEELSVIDEEDQA